VREFSLKGFARSHEDVAEFYRRLESGIYFVNIDPVIQQVTQDVDFPQLEVVSFEASVLVTYNPEGTIRMAAADLPEALRAMFKKQLEAEREKTSEENDGKGGKG